MAAEYCNLCYRRWEDSWADDAVVKDKRRGIYADPTKVRDIDHDGKYYSMHGCPLCEPSPQRTRVLFQAGASERGSDFAAEHAECVFLMGPTPQIAGDYARNIRSRMTKFGRDPSDVLCFGSMKIITGGTEVEARAKYDKFYSEVSYVATLALISGWTGVHFQPIRTRPAR